MVGQTEITLHDKYVLSYVSGEALPPAEIKMNILKTLGLAIESDLNIVFQREEFVKEHATETDFYDFVKLIHQCGFKNKIAVVFPEKMHFDTLNVVEIAAENLGIKCRLFSEMNEALPWLDDNA